MKAAHAGVAPAGPAAAQSASVLPDGVSDVLRMTGRALDPRTRGRMEDRFGHGFSDVRVHDDAQAARSAAEVSAHAYTVGNHVVLGRTRPVDGTAAGDRLLAHELAHVVQQRGSVNADAVDLGRMEAEAEQVAQQFAGDGALPVLSPAGPTLARDGIPSPDANVPTPGEAATTAEAACDFRTLCRLSFSSPEIVTTDRLRTAFFACYPSVSPVSLLGGNPCFNLNFGVPTAIPETPTEGGTTPSPEASPEPAESGFSFPSTNVKFDIGAAAVSIDLPTSASIRLPIPFQGAERVVIQMNASTSEFSFKITINAVPHVRIIASASTTTGGDAKANLTLETTRTVCRATSPEAARTKLTKAGEELRDAIRNAQNPPPLAEDASEFERDTAAQMRIAKVVGGIAKVHSTIESVQSACSEVPVASFSIGAHGPLSSPGLDAEPEETFLGASVLFHF
jgi:hypothetical protein